LVLVRIVLGWGMAVLSIVGMRKQRPHLTARSLRLAARRRPPEGDLVIVRGIEDQD
jgi:hypothetical protein